MAEKLEVISFLELELVRLENRKPSKQNDEDKISLTKTLEYLKENRDNL